MALKCTKLPQYIPNGHRIYLPSPFLGSPKFTQIRISGLKIYHLATLPGGKPCCLKLASGSFPGTDVMIFEIFSPKKFSKKLAFLTQNKAKLCKI
jgi:hypothetical protein